MIMNDLKGRKIHEFLTEELWCKGFLFKTQGDNLKPSLNDEVCPMCLNGAIFASCGMDFTPEMYQKKSRIAAAVGRIPKWNDKPERTFEEVIELCRRLDV